MTEQVCGSQYAFCACKFSGHKFPQCAATRELFYGCEYHDKGGMNRQLASRVIPAAVGTTLGGDQ